MKALPTVTREVCDEHRDTDPNALSTFYSLREARHHLPMRVSERDLTTWIEQGVAGVKLAAWVDGERVVTTRKAMAAFLRAVADLTDEQEGTGATDDTCLLAPGEALLTAKQAAEFAQQIVGVPVTEAAVRGWMRNGVGGVRLNTRRVAGRVFTTRGSLFAFFEATAAARTN